MVLSDRDERVVFISESPGDESLLFGGAIARLRSAGARVVLFYTPSEDGPHGKHLDTRELEEALRVLDVSQWRSFAGDPSELVDALRAEDPTAVVIGRLAADRGEAVSRAAAATRVPVFFRRREFEGTAQRLTAIDIHHEVERKLHAIRCYGSRWTVTDHTVTLEDGTFLAVTTTETYVRGDASPSGEELPVTPLSRMLAGAGGLVAGAALGMLGTVAHQTTLVIGQAAIPVGLVLALAGAATLLVGLRMVLDDRMVVLLAAVGMLGTIFVLSLRSTGGSVLVPAGLPGTLWTLVPALIAALAVAWPKVPPPREQQPHGVHSAKA